MLATFTLGYSHALPRVHTPVAQLQLFERGRIIGLQKLDGHIDELLHMMGIMYRWCVVSISSGLWNILTHRPGSGWLRSTDACQEQHKWVI